MTFVPESLQRYIKLIRFIMKYWNHDVMNHAMNVAMDDALTSEQDEKAAKDHYEKPEELVEDLKSMGATYVKMGQLLSTRPDLLPDEYLTALATLQDDVAEIPYAEIERITEDELGIKISKAFESFDEKPLASASIGQVHRAKLRTGKEVAVKIQRPGIHKQVIEELNTLQEVISFAIKHSKAARKYAFDDVLEDLRHMLLQELDYDREARNLVTLGENLSQYDHIVVPVPVSNYCSSKVLTMTFIEGQKITMINPVIKTDKDFNPVIDDLVAAYLKQIIVDGFAHADPHPGNVHLTPDTRIVLMDLGMVARFGNRVQENLLKLLIAVGNMDGDTVAETLLTMSGLNDEVNIPGFKKRINRLVMDNQGYLAREMRTGKLLMQINRIAADEGIRIGAELNIVGKILVNLDQIVATLTPDYDLQASISRHLQKLMRKKLLNELKPENMLDVLVEAKKLTRAIPERLNKITERLANNEFEIKVDAIDEQRFTDGFQKVANRITLGLIIAAMIIGASMLMRIPTSFTIFGYPGLAMVFFLAAAIAGFALIYTIIFKDEKYHKNSSL